MCYLGYGNWRDVEGRDEGKEKADRRVGVRDLKVVVKGYRKAGDELKWTREAEWGNGNARCGHAGASQH